MILAGAIGGAVWALIPALLRAFASTNEIITSLMLNYVAARIALYLIFFSQSHWRDLSPAAGSSPACGRSRSRPSGSPSPSAAPTCCRDWWSASCSP